jgi:transposase
MARKQAHPIVLSEAERHYLETIVNGGTHKVRTLHRAHMLLWSAAGKTDLEIAALLSVHPMTVGKTRQRWVEQHSLDDQPRAGRPPIMDGKQEAFLVALTCSDSPAGRDNWTMQLLADRLVELQVVDSPISDETVRRILKKTRSSRG